MKKDDQILLSIFLIAVSVGLAAFLLINKFSKSTIVHYFGLCRQSFSTFFSSTSHLTGIVVLAVVLLMFGIALVTTSLAIAKTLKKLLPLQNSSSKESQKRVKRVIRKVCISSRVVRIVLDTRPLAFSNGLFKKTIVLSDSLVRQLNDEELEAVIIHELVHIKRNHPIKLALNKILTNALFFVPVIKELNQQFHVHIELIADESVIERQKTNRYLKAALAKVVTAHDLSLLPSFGLRQWESRIKGLNGRRKQEITKLSLRSIQSSILILMIVFGLFLFPSESNANISTSYAQQACDEGTCNVHCDIRDVQTQEATQRFTPDITFSSLQ